jgi:hypothetical protein
VIAQRSRRKRKRCRRYHLAAMSSNL